MMRFMVCNDSGGGGGGGAPGRPFVHHTIDSHQAIRLLEEAWAFSTRPCILNLVGIVVTIAAMQCHVPCSMSWRARSSIPSASVSDGNSAFLSTSSTFSIAGLVLHEARRIPDVGQSFIFHGFRFDILERQRHQITRVRITPPVGHMNAE